MNSLVKILKIFTGNLVVLLTLLIIVELVLRILKWDYGNSPVDADPVVNYVHPSDYRYKMFSLSGEFGGFDIYFDSLGRRAQLPEKSKLHLSADPTVVFLGDSFVEALQVPYDSSFTGLLASRFPNITFLNYGVTGYSAVLYYLQCRKMLIQHHVVPAAVYMAIYSNDIREDSIWLGRAIYSSDQKEIVAINGGKKNGWLPLLRKSYLARTLRKISLQWEFKNRAVKKGDQTLMTFNGELEESPEIAGTLTAAYILKMDSLLKKYNIPFYVTVIPSKYRNYTHDLSKPVFSDRVLTWNKLYDLKVINLQVIFDSASTAKPQYFFYKKDLHLNAAGHRVVADVLEKSIRQIGLPKPD